MISTLNLSIFHEFEVFKWPISCIHAGNTCRRTVSAELFNGINHINKVPHDKHRYLYALTFLQIQSEQITFEEQHMWVFKAPSQAEMKDQGFFSEEETKKAQPVFYNNTRFMDYFLFLWWKCFCFDFAGPQISVTVGCSSLSPGAVWSEGGRIKSWCYARWRWSRESQRIVERKANCKQGDDFGETRHLLFALREFKLPCPELTLLMKKKKKKKKKNGIHAWPQVQML